MLRCEVCGSERAISYKEIGEPLLKLERELEAIEGLGDPDFAAFDRVREEYYRDVEASFGACECGGRRTFAAPLRCRACRSTDIDLGKPWRLYD